MNELSRDRLFIGGRWTRPHSRELFEVIDPYTEQVIATVPSADRRDVNRAVAAARKAFDHGPWPLMTPVERGAVVARLARLYRERLEEMAQTVTAEMGSPITFSRTNQAPVPAQMLEYYAGLADTFPFEEPREGVDGPLLIRREPVGVVAAVVPWNVPQWVTMTKLAPALIAGCTIVLKPAPETPLDAYLLAEILAQAGIPDGVVNIVPAGREVSQYLVAHPGVDKVAFSGSVRAGRTIGAICGEQIKRCSLELGGKSAAIILEDADLDHTIGALRTGSLLNSGQACAAQTRILVPRARQAEITDALAAMMRSLVVGDPADPATEIGPMVTRHQQHRVLSYIRCGLDTGATLVVGGQPGKDRGWYVQPTLFTNVEPWTTIAQEEIFGPVLVVIGYDDEDEAVRLANDSSYGLSGTVWTANHQRGLEIARQVRTGNIGINEFRLDLAAPFGGYKTSGIGRELGLEGLATYLEVKAIHQADEPA